jgi:hypothetical protein
MKYGIVINTSAGNCALIFQMQKSVAPNDMEREQSKFVQV